MRSVLGEVSRDAVVNLNDGARLANVAVPTCTARSPPQELERVIGPHDPADPDHGMLTARAA